MRYRSTHAAAPAALKAIARLNNAPDFRARSVARLGAAPNLEKVNEAGEFKYGAVNDYANGWTLATYGKIINLSRQALVNDDLGAFATLLRKFGEAAARREADELVSILVTPGNVDSAALFSTDRSSLITTSALALGTHRTSAPTVVADDARSARFARMASVVHTAFDYACLLAAGDAVGAHDPRGTDGRRASLPRPASRGARSVAVPGLWVGCGSRAVWTWIVGAFWLHLLAKQKVEKENRHERGPFAERVARIHNS